MAQAGQEPAGPARAMTLEPKDYIEIQQLSARYIFAIDACTNGGYDFASLFTDDGQWSLSQEWGVVGTTRFQGRDKLAEAGAAGRTAAAIRRRFLDMESATSSPIS